MLLHIQPGCRVDRDTRLARWSYTTPVCYRILAGPDGESSADAGKEFEGSLYDISPAGLSVRSDSIPAVGSRLELRMVLGKRELTATGIVRNNGLRGPNSFGVELTGLSRIDMAVLRAFLNDYREKAA
jgi:hypothetical protein